MKALGEAVAGAGLVQVQLSGCGASAEAEARLHAQLFSNAIEALSRDSLGPTADLSRLGLTPESISRLGPALQKASSTTRLDIRSNPLLGDAGIGALIEAVSAPSGPRLESVLAGGAAPLL